MKRLRSAVLRHLRDSLLPQARRRRSLDGRRLLQHEQLEQRCVLTLPAAQTFAEGDALVYNGPTVDSVNDTLSFDAFIDFAGDVDSYYFAPQFSGTYTIDVGDFGNTVDPEVAVYIASTGARVGYNDDLSAFNDDARLVLNLDADVRYIIAVADNPGTTAGNVSIIVSAAFRTGSFLLTPDAFGDASASVLLDVPTDIDYYSITAPADATGGLTISATGSTFNQRFALFNSAGTLLQGPLVSINISNANPSQEYRVAVFSNGYATSGTLNLNVNFAQSGAAVTNTLDAGPGSLRQAILDANAHPNDPGVPDKIRFAISGAGPFAISLASALPFITEAVDINGSTQPGTGATPTVAIDGSALSGTVDGLKVTANGTSIRGLNVRKFSGDGIEVQASSVLLQGNTIGTDWGGIAGLGNKGNGILLKGANNRVDANVVSGNVQSGIAIVGDTSDSNVLTNNTVGARFGGTVALPNAANGIVVTDGDLNEISGNLVSGNTLAGVVLSGTAVTNTLINNKIGTTSAGSAALPNGGDGVVIQSPRNRIGGNLPAQRNLISGNGKTGITLTGTGASNNVVEGNFIGTNVDGTAALPNVSDGIRVVNASGNRLGSATDAAAGNVISGNGGSGISFSQAGSTGGLVLGNLIGTTADGLSALGNAGSGVLLFSSATGVQIGGTNATSRNVIAANGASGVSISSSASLNKVSRNRIGVNAAGASRGNTNAGISLQGRGNTIGGANATFANIIAGNPQGITISGANAVNNTISFNTIGTDTASNTGRGIQVTGGAANNTIGPMNTIRRNETGIRIDDGSLQNRITQNSISENVNLGIDLFPTAGVTANDVGDADTGGNRLQNSPFMSANPSLIGSDLEVTFGLSSSPANSAYPLTIEFFVSDGGGEGAKFLGSTVYTAANFSAGVKTVSFAGAGAGLTAGTTKIVGVATDLNGNTSEFSAQRTLAAGGGARLAASAVSNQKTVSSVDLNHDGVVNRTDALQLISFLNHAFEVDVKGLVASSSLGTSQYDTNGDGVVSPLDVLAVVRGLQKTGSASQSLPSAKQVQDLSFSDSVLQGLDSADLSALRPALVTSPWIVNR